jgi:hypothetical protein
VNCLVDPERRVEKLLHQHLGQRVRNAHGQAQGSRRGPPFEHAHQILAQREDLVRVTENAPADVRQHEVPARAFEQLLPQNVLEPLHLAADRRLRQSKLGARARDGAIARDSPEVEQVMVVQPLHGPRGYHALAAYFP